MRFEPHRVEPDADGTLVICKDRPSPTDLEPSMLVAAVLGILVVLLLMPLWATFISADAKIRLTGGQAGLVVGAIVLILAGAPAAVRAAMRRATLGVWRIGAGGFEFAGANGDRRSLTPDQIVRVGWYPTSIRLVGRDTRITLRPEGIPLADWQPVRDRVEMILSPRFDLTVAPVPDTKMVLGRVLPASAAGCLFILVGFWAIVHDPIRWVQPVIVTWLLLMGMPLILGTILAGRDHRRQVWRHPRLIPGEENGPATEVGA